MNHAARVLACRSAPLADAYCDQLREALAEMARAARVGALPRALESFEDVATPMQKLLVFTVVAADLLRDAQHPLRPQVEGFTRSMLGALDRLEAAIVARDWASLIVTAQFELVPSLDAYHRIGARLAAALEPRLAA